VSLPSFLAFLWFPCCHQPVRLSLLVLLCCPHCDQQLLTSLRLLVLHCACPCLRRVHSQHRRYEADIGGVRFLGTSGQPLDDMRKFMSPVGETGLQSIKSTNAATEAVAPAAPDSDAAGKVDEDGDGDVVMGEAETGTSRKDLKKPKLVLSDLCKTLTWRHVAPTAPDTLGVWTCGVVVVSHTVADSRRSCPHVFGVGTPSTMVQVAIHSLKRTHLCWSRHPTSTLQATKMHSLHARCQVRAQPISPACAILTRLVVFTVPDSEGFVRVITVPRFSTTHTAVLLNLRTLDARPVVFSAE